MSSTSKYWVRPAVRVHAIFWCGMLSFCALWLHGMHRLSLGVSIVTSLLFVTPGALITAALGASLLRWRGIAPRLIGAAMAHALWFGAVAGIDALLPSSWRFPLINALTALFMALVLGTFLPVVIMVDRAQDAARAQARAAAASAAAKEAQLHALRWQLNPHFLFNTLNSISARIAENGTSAQHMVDDLSALLRDTLDSPPVGTVGDELRRVEIYLNLQKGRFEEGLVTEWEIDPEVLPLPLPPLLLQPLVENAVIHGRRHRVPVTVEIAAKYENACLTLSISNTGALSGSSSNGDARFGLKSVRERLELFAPGRSRFSLIENQGWIRAEVEVRNA